MVDSAVSLQDRWNRKATEPHWRNEDTSTLSRHQKKPWTPTQSLYVFQMEYLSFDLGAWYCRHLPTIYLRTSKVHVDFVTSCNILLWSLVTVYPSLSVYLTLTSFERKSPRFAQKKKDRPDRPPSQKQVTTVNEGLSNGSPVKSPHFGMTPEDSPGDVRVGTYLVGGWPTPLKNMKISWDDDIPKIWKVIKFHGSKPPTSHGTSWYLGNSLKMSLHQLHQAKEDTWYIKPGHGKWHEIPPWISAWHDTSFLWTSSHPPLVQGIQGIQGPNPGAVSLSDLGWLDHATSVS